MKVKNRVSIPLPSQNRSSSHSLVEWPLLDVGFIGGGGEGFEAYIVKNNEKYLPRGIRHSTDMHTGAQSAKKDVISTKPQKGRASRGPKKHKEAQPNLLAK